MKKFLLLTGALFTLFSCSNDLEFNEHAFQANKNNEFWKASEFSVSISENGFLNIIGVHNNQVVTLNVESSEAGLYDLGGGSNSTAFFSDEEGQGYTTEYRGNGQIIIEEYNPVSQTFTGSFKFNAYSASGEVVNFINGIFYQVPLEIKDETVREGELKASVDASELQADEVEAVVENGMIEILGVSAEGSYIKLYIPETTLAGSYNLNQLSASGTYAVYGYANGVTSTAQFGTLFVNGHDLASGEIRGSFTFTTLLPNSVSVENGSFKAYY